MHDKNETATGGHEAGVMPVGGRAGFQWSRVVVIAPLAVGLVVGAAYAIGLPGAAEARVEEAIKTAMPNATASVHCGGVAVKDLCEVTFPGNIGYATRDGRYMFVGSLLDLKEKKDLADERLAQIAALEGSVTGQGDQRGAAQGGQGQQADAQQAPRATKLSKAVDLPVENAVVLNRGAGQVVNIFIDMACPYCHALEAEWKGLTNVEVRLYPVDFLGRGREKAKLVLCSNDRAQALGAALNGGELKAGSDCSDAERRLAQNTDFAQQAGVQGVPAIVKADGSLFTSHEAPKAAAILAWVRSQPGGG